MSSFHRNQEITLKVSESTGKDVGRGLARIDPADMQRLGAEIGDIVEVAGQKTTVCKLLPAFKEHRGNGRIQIDGIVRENAGAAIGESAVVRRIAPRPPWKSSSIRSATRPPAATSNTSAACWTACRSSPATACGRRCSATATPISWSRAPCRKGRW